MLTNNTAVRRAIAAVPEHAWRPVNYPGAVRDPDTGEWISDAEVPYTAFASTKDRVTAVRVKTRDSACDLQFCDRGMLLEHRLRGSGAYWCPDVPSRHRSVIIAPDIVGRQSLGFRCPG